MCIFRKATGTPCVSFVTLPFTLHVALLAFIRTRRENTTEERLNSCRICRHEM